MFFRSFAILCAVIVLAGCNNEKNRDLLDLRTEQALLMAEKAQEPGPKKSYDPLDVSDKIWVGNSAVKLRSGHPLPDRVEGVRGVALVSPVPMGLSEIATVLSYQTAIPVRVGSDVMSGSGPGQPFGMNSGPDLSIELSYEGPLSGLLDKICGTFGLSWNYDGDSITFSRYITNVFSVQALPGELSVTDGLAEDSGGSGGGGGSAAAAGSYSMGSSSTIKQSSEMTVQMKVWDDINATVRAIIGGTGTVVASPSSGTLAVTTTPEKMRAVATYMEEENKRLSHQIAINVEIYAVTVQDEQNFDMSLSTAFARMGAFQGALGGATGTMIADTAASAGTFSLAILNPTTHTQRVGTVFQALSSVGDATRVAQFPLTTLNNRPVSRRIGRDRTYVASIQRETNEFGTSVTVEPGTIREGFSLQLTPRLLDDGKIMLQYSLSLVDIVRIADFETGQGSIELPETSSRIFVQQTMLKSGATLVIGGYDDEKTEQTSQGVGSPYNYLFGGGSSNSKTRAMLFVAITPQVLDAETAESP